MKSVVRKRKNDEGMREIRRLWGDIDVIDSAKDLRLMIVPSDVASAKRKDPGACVFAQACKRSFGSSKVLFFRSVAYVEIPDSAGRLRIERFIMPPPMRAMIEAFDKGEATLPKAGFILKAPSYARRLDNERKRKQASRRKRLMLLGHSETEEYKIRKGKQGIGKYESPAIAVDLSVRSGVGAVHFPLREGKQK